MTLIFHQAVPKVVDNQNLQNFKVTQQEVARITVPIPTIIELKNLIEQQIENNPLIIKKGNKLKPLI